MQTIAVIDKFAGTLSIGRATPPMKLSPALRIRAALFNSFQRLKEDDISRPKEEGRDARTVDMFDGKTDKER